MINPNTPNTAYHMALIAPGTQSNTDSNIYGRSPTIKTMDDAYQYSAIKDRGTIRLILLEPAADLEAKVHCSLQNRTLEECENDIAEHYVALSYVWGDGDDTRTVSVDDKALLVTASLESALRHIRDTRRKLHVWADGVCIDQGNIEDRNQQVREMGSIYSNARHTVIFLGPSTPESDYVMKSMANQKKHRHKGNKTDTQLDTFGAMVGTHILAQKWFTRVWVLQELVLSVDPWIQRGQERVRWDDFYRWLPEDPSSSYEYRQGRERVDGMNEIRTKHRLTLHEVEPRKAVQNFLDVLNKRRASGVSNPRDMIYGHLGLADSSIQSHVPIDYDKSICQVFEDITNYYINTTKDLSILSLVEEISLGMRRTNIPSWVPDWTCSYIPGLSTHRSRLPGTKSVFSLVIPHVIAVPGWNLGTARLVMPCSSWNPDESRPNPNKEEGYLQMWLTRPECQEAQKIILDFHRTMCEHLYEEICEVSIADVQSKIDHDLLLQLIAIVVESFADVELVKESEDALMFVKLANLFYSLLNAIAKSQHSGSTIAILDGMRIIQVPAMTQVGDVVCNPAQYEELTILRPEVVGLSGEAIAALKADFANKEVHSEEKGVAAKARLGSFKFVTYGPPVSEAANRDIQKGIKGWNCITEAEIEESFQIFALH